MPTDREADTEFAWALHKRLFYGLNVVRTREYLHRLAGSRDRLHGLRSRAGP
jgi:hypothetical protein